MSFGDVGLRFNGWVDETCAQTEVGVPYQSKLVDLHIERLQFFSADLFCFLGEKFISPQVESEPVHLHLGAWVQAIVQLCHAWSQNQSRIRHAVSYRLPLHEIMQKKCPEELVPWFKIDAVWRLHAIAFEKQKRPETSRFEMAGMQHHNSSTCLLYMRQAPPQLEKNDRLRQHAASQRLSSGHLWRWCRFSRAIRFTGQ